jgi:hypothetical protein
MPRRVNDVIEAKGFLSEIYVFFERREPSGLTDFSVKNGSFEPRRLGISPHSKIIKNCHRNSQIFNFGK